MPAKRWIDIAMGTLQPLLWFQRTGCLLYKTGDLRRVTQHDQMPGLQGQRCSVHSLCHGRLECRSDGSIVGRNNVPCGNVLPGNMSYVRTECVRG